LNLHAGENGVSFLMKKHEFPPEFAYISYVLFFGSNYLNHLMPSVGKFRFSRLF
jgi:hypothetical protein